MSSNQLNILIVEDEPLTTIFLKRIVEDFGHKVIGVCDNSESAIEKILEEKPDVIFMDINIKGPLDGITVIKRVMYVCEASIIYISGYDESEILDEALSTNPSNYLIKPIHENDVKIALSVIKKNQTKTANKNYLVFDKVLYYDFETKELIQTGNTLKLSIIEKKLVDLFIDKKNTNLSIEFIKETIWDDSEIANSTIRDKISKLRNKVPTFPLKTNFGRGYILDMP